MKQDLSIFKKSDNKKELSEKKKGKVGRTPKSPEDRLTEKITLNFTKKEKDKLLAISEQKGRLPLTIMIRNLLIEKEWI